MQCKVCGFDRLREAEYKTGELRAPALECERCHALNLDERVAKSERDLDSVRKALVARQTASFDSGTHRTSRTLAVAEVEPVAREVELVVTEARVCLEFLAQTTEGELAKAVEDARRCNQRIGALIEDLVLRCATAGDYGASADSSGDDTPRNSVAPAPQRRRTDRVRSG